MINGNQTSSFYTAISGQVYNDDITQTDRNIAQVYTFSGLMSSDNGSLDNSISYISKNLFNVLLLLIISFINVAKHKSSFQVEPTALNSRFKLIFIEDNS